MRVYVHGNCQAPAIASLLAAQFPEWEVSSYEVFTQKIIDEADAYRDSVMSADIIISQPIRDNYREREDLSLAWIRSQAKPGSPVVVFPSMFFDGQLVGWRSVAFPGFGMPYLDMLVLHCAALGMSAERTAAIVLDDDLYSDPFIAQEISLSIAEMRRREIADDIDIPLSPFLDQFGTTTPLFHVTNHPYRQAIAYITNAILAYLGLSGKVPMTGDECLRFPHVPLAGSVRRFLRKNGGGDPAWEVPEPDKYLLPDGHRYPCVEYCDLVVTHLRSYQRKELLDALRQPHVRPFLQRLADTVPTIPGIELHRA